MTAKRWIALIPAYEPTGTLIALARKLREEDFTVLVVDDGSGVQYAQIFDALKTCATVLHDAENHGKGHALKMGLAYVAQQGWGNSVIITLDADGQHTPEDARRVAEAAQIRPDALTLGVRHFGADTPARSRFGNTVTREVYLLSTGQRVSDTQTGLRAFGTPLLPLMRQIPGERYEYEMEVLLECSSRSVPVQEVPIQTIYENNNAGSHFRSVRDAARIYGNILKFATSSLIGFAVDYSLYSLLVVLLAGLGTAVCVPVSNISARIVSAGVNFSVNKRLVFRNRDSTLKTGAQYFALAACILAGNTVLLSLLVGELGVNRFAAKLVTEVTFFTLSFLAQRFWIFGGRRKERARLHRTKKI